MYEWRGGVRQRTPCSTRGHAVVEHHGVQRSSAAGRAKGAPLGAPVGVNGGGRLLLLERQRVRLVKEELEEAPLPTEGRELHAPTSNTSPV